MAGAARTMGDFDYVIVGGGTSGCLLANRLSADPDTSVLLLEAGGKDDWIWIHIPVGYLYCIGNPRTDWCYRTEPDPGLNGRSILYARGRVLGGSSSINAMLYRTGPLTMAPSQLGAFLKSDPAQPTPNMEYHVQPLSLEKFGDPLHPFPAFTASICNLRPTSRGHIRIKSGDPRVHPAIKLNYLSTPEDQRIAVQGLRVTRRVVTGTETMKKYSPEEFLPGPAFQSDEELVKAAGNVGTTIFHPVGTCKMGRAEDATAVVDPQFRVRGIERLRVIDASIMPAITSGNTNSPTLMIAERGALMVRGG